MEQVTVTALAVDPHRGWRARYGYFDDEEDSGLRVDRYDVVGWACLGRDIWPVRVEAASGRGILVGSALDPDRDALLAVLTPGEDWQTLPGMDERVRAIIQEGISSNDSTDEE